MVFDRMSKQPASILGMRLGVSSWPTALIGIVMIKAVLSLALKPGSFVQSYSADQLFGTAGLGDLFRSAERHPEHVGRSSLLGGTRHRLWPLVGAPGPQPVL